MIPSSPTYIPLVPSYGYNKGPHIALNVTPDTLEMTYVGEMEYHGSVPRPRRSSTERSAPLGDLAFQVFKSSVEYATAAADRVIWPEHILVGIVSAAQDLISIIDPEHFLSIDRIKQLPSKRSDNSERFRGLDYYAIGGADEDLRISGDAARLLWNAVRQADNPKALYVHSYHLLARLSQG